MRLFTLRGPVLRVPWPLVLIGWAGRLLWVALRWLAAAPWVLGALCLALGLWWLVRTVDWWWLVIAVGGVCAALGVVMEARPNWWQHLTGTAASWRRRRWYLQRWDMAVVGAKLEGVEEMPTLISHRFGGAPGERDLDVLTVRMAAGQLVSDWRAAQVRLAATWELQRLRCHAMPGHPRDVQLFGRRFGLTPETRTRWAERASQLAGVQEPSTAVEEPVEPPVPLRPHGAFPKTPRSAS